MFVRVKKVGPYQYLQIAQNRREGKRVKQSIIATLGRLDKLTASGAIDQLLRSAARFAERLMVLAEHSTDAHDSPDATVVSIGPALIFERLWRETGCQAVVRKLLATRHHHFDVERAVFMTVLHRLMVSGSDRSALQWRRDGLYVREERPTDISQCCEAGRMKLGYLRAGTSHTFAVARNRIR